MGIKAVRNFIYFNITNNIKKNRMSMFCELMKINGTQSILDVGAGSGVLWEIFLTNADLKHNLNLTGMDIHHNNSRVYRNFVLADARNMPFPDGVFDIVFSNSVIEHVGGFEQQKLMANEIRRVGERYFVQVPNKHFPIEPHYFIPFLQYLPIKWQQWITSILFGASAEIHLPSKKELRLLFPGAKITGEKMFGLTKSFYIYKG